MPTSIRRFDPVRDADAVSSFYNANRYGPVQHGTPLTGERLIAVLRERGARLFFVAEQADRIIGTIGYTQVSGRRVAEPGTLFAGMLLIAQSHRSGLLAGQLFTESFRELLVEGVRALRVEVDPLNRKAFPLYVRVGFRAVAAVRPDEYGYVELVSHLPGVTSDLVAAFASNRDIRDVLPKLDWRTLIGSGRQDERSGIRVDAGRTVVDYDFKIGPVTATATVDVASGEIAQVIVNGDADPRFGREQDRATDQEPETPTLDFGAFRVTVDPYDGALQIAHPDVLGFVVRELFPVAGDEPIGFRRPAPRRVRSTVIGDCIVSESDHIRREVVVDGTRLLVRCSVETGVVRVPLSVLPRRSRLHVVADGFDECAHQVIGLWPVEATDFEAVADTTASWPMATTRAAWQDGAVLVELTGDAGTRMRIEGPGVLLTGGTALDHAFAATGAGSVPRRPVNAEDVRTAPMAWSSSRRGGENVLSGERAGNRVTASGDAGIIRWESGGDVVFDGSHPSTRKVGPLRALTGMVWASVQRARDELDHGPEWASPDEGYPFVTARAEPGWTVEAAPDSLTLVAHEPAMHADETVFWFAPRGRPPFVDFADPDGAIFRLQTEGPEWRTWTDEVRIPTSHGLITIRAIAGGSPEILVRSTGTGIVVAMFTRNHRNSAAARWSMAYARIGNASPAA